jgi:hypothetical protein
MNARCIAVFISEKKSLPLHAPMLVPVFAVVHAAYACAATAVISYGVPALAGRTSDEACTASEFRISCGIAIPSPGGGMALS